MKNLLCAALVLASLPLATAAVAQPLDRSNYLTYSYRDHHRAYGIYSLSDGALPPDEVYIDPCYKWVSTPGGVRKKFVCRS